MKTVLIILILYFGSSVAYSQGYNHNWLLGYGIRPPTDTNTTFSKARLLFDVNNDTVIGEERKMAFFETQATISDANGNLIAASNGCWIMNANGDTMLNGSGINPGLFTHDYNYPTTGLVLPHGCIMLPYPGDSSKIVMFHQTGNYAANLSSTELYYSVIDKALDGGLGGVITNKKNVIVFSDTLGWGLAACQHANGRDWWIIAYRDRSNVIYKVLFTPNGVSSITSQTFNFPVPFYGNSGEPTFSPDGTKFAYTYGYLSPFFMEVRVFSFDRCSGDLDSISYVPKANQAGFGLSFSPNSKYLYYSSFSKVFQLNTDTIDIAASDTLVATYDGYVYPFPNSDTNFWLMYLAANGKIYISPSGGVIDYHVINSPDSAGIACDMQQHSLHLPCYAGWANVYHPNYYLGRLQGSPCDTLQWTGADEINNHDFHFRIYPNPISNNNLSIGYLLPQNKAGVFSIYDVTGKQLFKYSLPQWSNEQSFSLPDLSNGVYSCVITSNNYRVSKKLVVIRE